MCNNALLAVAGRLAAAVHRPQPEVYQELKAGLNPGVILVPAHTMLIGLCQERGCSYEAL
jgi:alanine-alpha-ketoisovalerate/valine-pyruvate aminotransferase